MGWVMLLVLYVGLGDLTSLLAAVEVNRQLQSQNTEVRSVSGTISTTHKATGSRYNTTNSYDRRSENVQEKGWAKNQTRTMVKRSISKWPSGSLKREVPGTSAPTEERVYLNSLDHSNDQKENLEPLNLQAIVLEAPGVTSSTESIPATTENLFLQGPLKAEVKVVGGSKEEEIEVKSGSGGETPSDSEAGDDDERGKTIYDVRRGVPERRYPRKYLDNFGFGVFPTEPVYKIPPAEKPRRFHPYSTFRQNGGIKVNYTDYSSYYEDSYYFPEWEDIIVTECPYYSDQPSPASSLKRDAYFVCAAYALTRVIF